MTIFDYVMNYDDGTFSRIIICTIAIIHTFILKSNNLTKEIANSYEYKLISRVLKIVYIPIVIPIACYIIITNYNIWFTAFTACYIILITISLVIHNPINEKIEDVFAICCIVLLIIFGVKYEPDIIANMLNMYINYIVISVVTVDLTNEWIMRRRTRTSESDDSIRLIMRDVGYEYSEIQQLQPGEEIMMQPDHHPMQEP